MKFNYMLLSRLIQDCNYFLNLGNRNSKFLWALNVPEHISKMKELYNLVPIKPDWITWNEILNLEIQMNSKD